MPIALRGTVNPVCREFELFFKKYHALGKCEYFYIIFILVGFQLVQVLAYEEFLDAVGNSCGGGTELVVLVQAVNVRHCFPRISDRALLQPGCLTRVQLLVPPFGG